MESSYRLLAGLDLRERSWVEHSALTLAVSSDWRLVVRGAPIEGLVGERTTQDGVPVLVGPANHANLGWLRARFPWLTPRTLGIGCSAGFGDRLGLATPGHIRALRAAGHGIAPVFAQQSIREMARTRRTPEQVLDDAAWGVFAESWRDGFGADADHLKTQADVDSCAAAGYTFFTFDPGEQVWADADIAMPREVKAAVAALPWRELEDSPDAMLKRYSVPAETVMRAAAKYGSALAHVLGLNRRLKSRLGLNYELEVSVDETVSPTTPEQHEYLARELHRLGIEFVSLALRFPGRFEKGIDFVGDIDEFEVQFVRHVEIAQRLGPYKLGLHSGSDKFSIYEIAARRSGRLVHLKTAGTSWLEALRTIGHIEADLLAEIYRYALERYPIDRASYHVSAETATAPTRPDLDNNHARQILHVTFGAVMERFGAQILALLDHHREEYEMAIQRHFERHLAPFQKPA